MYKNPHPAHTMLADVIFKERQVLIDEARHHIETGQHNTPHDYVKAWDALNDLTKKYTRREMLNAVVKLGLDVDNEFCWGIDGTRPIKEMGEVITNYVLMELKDVPDWMVNPASRLPISSIDYGED